MQEKITRTNEDLLQLLGEQIEFLKSSVAAFDAGSEIEAKRIATIIRVLLHDTNQSKSLLGQLGMKNKKFLTTCQIFENSPAAQRGLVVKFLGKENSPKYHALLDDAGLGRKVDFSEWWNEKIFLAKEKKDDSENGYEEISFSRRDLVLILANKDGGAHVDPEVDAAYLKLSKHNLLGDLASDGKSWIAYTNPERASMRQIAHEVLKTLIDDYHQNPKTECDGFMIGNFTLG
jgi:hypothetical protein